MGNISAILGQLQRFLFPALEEDHGFLTAGHKRLAALLEIIRIEDFVPTPARGYRGNPEDDRRPMARAFVAKAVCDFPTTRALLDQLRSNPVLRRLCGWERAGEVPSPSTFSRAFAQFAASDLPGRVHEALIREQRSQRPGGKARRRRRRNRRGWAKKSP